MERFVKYLDVKKLKDEGFKINAIAKKLNMSRNTVKVYLNKSPDEFEDFVLSLKDRRKILDPYRENILQWLTEHPDLSGAQVFDWLEDKLNFKDVAENTVRNYVNELRETYHIPKVVRQRIYSAVPESPMGHQIQVDFGQTIVEKNGGGNKRLYFIAFILSHSRFKYAEWLDRPFRTMDMVRCHENAFHFFEGMAVEMVYDQDAILSVSENAGDLLLTAEFSKYQSSRGFTIYLCKKSDPESKGKIEQVVKFVKNNFSKNRVYDNLTDWNEATMRWLERTGNFKIHHNIKRRPFEVHALEKQHLQKVSTTYIFENVLTQSITRKIHKDNVIRYEGNRYSVPSGTYKDVSQNMAYLVVTEDRFLSIRLKPTGPILAKHAISDEKGLIIHDPAHRKRNDSKRDLLIHQVEDAFVNKEEIRWFIEALTNKYPRHLIDQLKVIQKVIRMYPNSLGEALSEVKKLHLISGNDLRDIAFSLEKRVVNSSVAPIKINGKYSELKAPERSGDAYLKVLGGGRNA